MLSNLRLSLLLHRISPDKPYMLIFSIRGSVPISELEIPLHFNGNECEADNQHLLSVYIVIQGVTLRAVFSIISVHQMSWVVVV